MICMNASRMCCTSFQLLPVLVSISFQLRPTDLFVVSLNATFRRPSHIQKSQNVSYVTVTCYRWRNTTLLQPNHNQVSPPQLLPISCFQSLWQWSRLPNSACHMNQDCFLPTGCQKRQLRQLQQEVLQQHPSNRHCQLLHGKRCAVTTGNCASTDR